MTSRDSAFDDYVLKIYDVLDRLDYYRLLGVGPQARVPEVKKAFFSIAAKFHPDRNRDASEKVRSAIYEIFKRLNEAYRVLSDHEKRKLYDALLAEGKVRLEVDDRRATMPKKPEDTIQSREARQFYRRAAEAFEGGDLLQADLHVKVARSREGQPNEAIDALFAQVREAKAAKKKKKN